MNIIQRARLALVVFVLALVAAPAAVFASPPPPVNVNSTDVSTVVIAAPLVTLIVSLLIPLINGFLTKPSTPAGVKAIGTIVLNAAAALIINGVVSDGASTFSSSTLYTAILGTIISIASYAGVYKPMNVTSNAGGKLASIGAKG